MSKRISAAIIGGSTASLQAALYLAQLGIAVKFITGSRAFAFSGSDQDDARLLWSTVLKALKHPSIDFFYKTQVSEIAGSKGNFSIHALQQPNFIDSDLCTGCKRCEENCSTRLMNLKDGVQVSRAAIHKPYPGNKSVPSAMLVEKKEAAPCRLSCPLGVNVQGFVALLANNKVKEAYDLINRSAPLGGILGRLCKHPCEANCSRSKVDSPVSIRALHRFACDNIPIPPHKTADPVAVAEKAKVAIVGSGPAGLMAAWELKHRGYDPTIFESHYTYGGLLATGIPRFRLTRETRVTEINKLIGTGITVRTGVTVGRDINFAYFRERGYKAFFLAIGAMKNNKLGIPGEDLEGVIDCMSFLLTLNQMDETFIGSNILVIGDGNTAVDSARVAIRKNMGSVKIISWTVPEELTASRDEIEEAFEEGVSIEYSAYPVEIVGDGNKVTGVRFQRTRLTDSIMRNGGHRPEPLPGTDFIIEADHVIVAIGQSADPSQLNLEGLAVDGRSGTIKVNPVTLETNIHGIFAGGDCVRGPNNVVAAMADGARAAESIDRYLSGLDMEAGRESRPIKAADVDISTLVASSAARAQMPYLDLESRRNDYEETTLGFSPETAAQEAGRCLSCALCSECMECVKVCGAKAITHDKATQNIDMTADIILRFAGDEVGELSAGVPGADGIYNFAAESGQSSSIISGVMRAVLDLRAEALYRPVPVAQMEQMKADRLEDISGVPIAADVDGKQRTYGVFLCRCNGNNSSAIDFDRLARLTVSHKSSVYVSEVEQACAETDAANIASRIKELGLDRAIVAACRCCNHEDVCYSCNDRRILCRKHLDTHAPARAGLDIDYVNIRELCAWTHANDRSEATDIAHKMIQAALSTAASVRVPPSLRYPVNPVALFIGDSAASKTSAIALETLGYKVFVISSKNGPGDAVAIRENAAAGNGNIVNRKMPALIHIAGSPGNYQVKLLNIGNDETIHAGAIIVDASLEKDDIAKMDSTYMGRLIGRLVSEKWSANNPKQPQNNSKQLPFNPDNQESSLARAGLFIDTGVSGSADPADGNSWIDLAIAILLYFHSNWINVQPLSAYVDAGLCRGCGTCSAKCPLIEVCDDGTGKIRAYLERSACTGCGACAGACPTGAMRLGSQTAAAVNSTIKSYLCTVDV